MAFRLCWVTDVHLPLLCRGWVGWERGRPGLFDGGKLESSTLLEKGSPVDARFLHLSTWFCFLQAPLALPLQRRAHV